LGGELNNSCLADINDSEEIQVSMQNIIKRQINPCSLFCHKI